MKRTVVIICLVALLGQGAGAQEEPALAASVTAPMGTPLDAGAVSLDDFLWLKRPLVIFADTPEDPTYQRQMQRLADDPGPLAERDVVIITDTDPRARSTLRQRLRPHGFSVVLMDKDGEVKRRVPSLWDVREISHAIDRFPQRREELRAPRG